MSEVNNNELLEQVRAECYRVWKELTGKNPDVTFDPLMGDLYKSLYRRERTTLKYKIGARYYRIYSRNKDRVHELIYALIVSDNHTEIINQMTDMHNRRELDNRDIGSILFYGGLIKDPVMTDLIRFVGKKHYIQNYVRTDKYLIVDMLTGIRNPWNLPTYSKWKIVIFRIQDDNLIWENTIRGSIPSYWNVIMERETDARYKRVLEDMNISERIRTPYDPFDLVEK